jgi:tRNA(Ile)-lysidine synthase
MLREKILNTINKYNLIESQDNIIIGVSGGPDSICLLHVLNTLKGELNFKICVAHVNHMMREEADFETEYVEEICKMLNVPCFIKKEDIQKLSKSQKKGLEETGRKVRYEFFDEIARDIKGKVKIATAHNNNDKIETVLMNIFRGSGLSGLKGIVPIRENRYIKPLLEIDREEIEEYCRQNNLNPKIDKSNSDNTYTRNKIRNIVIPYIKKEVNSNIIHTLNRLSEVVTEEDEYLNKLAEKEYNKLILDKKSSQIILDLKKFNNLELLIKRSVILYTVNELNSSVCGIEKVNIDDIIKLCTNNVGNKFLIPTKGIKIYIKGGKIFYILL